MFYPSRGRSGGGVQEDPSLACLLLAIYSKEEREAGVLEELKEEEGKEGSGRWRNYSADRVIYSPEGGR